jgi:D-3-phosphoglycerate dehydrogenase
MPPPPFRVGFIDPPMYPSFVQTLAAAPDIELVRIPGDASVEDSMRWLETCHGYYAKASRDELPRPLHVTAELLARLPRLAIVASYGAGYDTIDLDACTAADVVAVNEAGGNARAVPEHAVGMMMVLLKRIPEAQEATRAGQVGARERLMGRELANRTVGIVGLGHAGSQCAALLKAIGSEVIAFDPYLDAAACSERGATQVDLPRLLADSDVISLHCPLTAETRNMFDAERFGAMRRDAIFINTARGSTYDESALLAALQSGHLGGAGLDVWEREPSPKEHPLLGHPAVIASPHTAGVTHESRDRVARMAAEAFIAVAAHQVPPRCLDSTASPLCAMARSNSLRTMPLRPGRINRFPASASSAMDEGDDASVGLARS